MPCRVRQGLRTVYDQPYGLMPVMATNIKLHLATGVLLLAAYLAVIGIDAVVPDGRSVSRVARVRWQRDDRYAIDTDPDRLDRDAIHAFLVTAYWSTGIPRDVMERSIVGSLCFGVYAPDGRPGRVRTGSHRPGDLRLGRGRVRAPRAPRARPRRVADGGHGGAPRAPGTPPLDPRHP